MIIEGFEGGMPLFHTTIEYSDDRSRSELLPHTDTPQKLETLLVCFADDDADPDLRTALYSPQ